MTTSERSVEIPLAVDYLTHVVKGEPVLELGCVTPYYILKRPNHVVYDLMDEHYQNIKRDLRSLTDEELQTNILSISTIEHINQSEYGIEVQNSYTEDILDRIIKNAKTYFITFPLGYNLALDNRILNKDWGEHYVTRSQVNRDDWMIVDKKSLTDSQKSFGGYHAANTVCVISNCCPVGHQ